MVEQAHWDNKILHDKGTGQDIVEEYNKINAGKYQFTVASDKYPTGNVVEGAMEFEYFIYYKVAPNAIVKKQITVQAPPQKVDIS